MSDSVLGWVIEHKEWCFATLCTVCGGAFAFLKWRWPTTKNREKSKNDSHDSVGHNGSGNTIAVIGPGATVNGGVIAGSHNVQTVVINHSSHPIKIPIRERKASIPTGNEIRQRLDGPHKGIPLVLQHELRQKVLKSFVNLSVAWPISIRGIYAGDEILTVDAIYGEESWGAYIRFEVRESDFPILNTLEEGHRAFIEGRIRNINDFLIELEVATLEFE